MESAWARTDLFSKEAARTLSITSTLAVGARAQNHEDTGPQCNDISLLDDQ